MTPTTIGELLHTSYANLAMAHAAVTSKSQTYCRTHFIIRTRLYAGLRKGTMTIGPLADDERLKMILPQACCYCGDRTSLSVDHLIPRHKGGANSGENLVWACRSCNSSKGARDVLEWLAADGRFPPLLLLRRYLKLSLGLAVEAGVLERPVEEAPPLPFSLAAIPTKYPQPAKLTLWVTELNGP